jgi:hypothetical protein
MKSPSVISIKVDLGYAFDYLAILEIKKDMNLLNKGIYSSFIEDLKITVGEQLFLQILDSQEYKELKESNLKTFIAVDMAKDNKILASEVNDCNYQRFQKKQQLHNKFCEETMKIEIKN